MVSTINHIIEKTNFPQIRLLSSFTGLQTKQAEAGTKKQRDCTLNELRPRESVGVEFGTAKSQKKKITFVFIGYRGNIRNPKITTFQH